MASHVCLQLRRAPSSHTEQPIPASLDAVVMSCLEMKPQERVQTAEDLIAQLDRVQLEERWTHERAVNWWHLHGSDGSGAATTAQD